MSYCLHTAEAVVDIMGLKTTSEISFYKKRALENGEPASMIKGGIEYFDISLLKKTKTQVKKELKEKKQEPSISIKQNTARKTKLTQLSFSFE
jgi:6-phosphogluconate dehydrogenase